MLLTTVTYNQVHILYSYTVYHYLFFVLVTSDYHFTDECAKICSEVLEFLKYVANNLQQGTIKIHELKIFTSHQLEAMNLFSPKVAGMITGDPSFNIAELIVQRNSEVQKFKSYFSAVRTLMEYCESFSKGNTTYL